MLDYNLSIIWQVGFRKGHDLLNDDNNDFLLIPNPWWGWCADPFLFEHEGEVFVFAEVWNYFKQRGSIGYYKISGRERDRKWHIAIDERYHMSYPMIWKDKKGIHICAETSRNEDLHIYDCIKFPNRWRMSTVLFEDVFFADSTFLLGEGGRPRYCFSYEILGINKGILHRYSFDCGKLLMESDCIITDDNRISRPGGHFVETKGSLIRVAQDCSKRYGEQLYFLEVGSIEPYSEEVKKVISYKSFDVKSCIGMHTYNRIKDFEVVDFQIEKVKVINIVGTSIHKLASKGKRLLKRILRTS